MDPTSKSRFWTFDPSAASTGFPIHVYMSKLPLEALPTPPLGWGGWNGRSFA